jgi:Tol biopolymer transport system component
MSASIGVGIPSAQPFEAPNWTRDGQALIYKYGGQGTINDPSWSPDSTRLAFVSNTDIP